MEAELKIVGAIVIGIMFLANTGIGIWIYKIMKVSDSFKEDFPIVKATIEEQEKDLMKIGFKIETLQITIATLKGEKADIAKVEAINSDFKTLKETINHMQKTFSNNTDRFIGIVSEFKESFIHINSSMGNISGTLNKVEKNLEQINEYIILDKNKG